MSRKFLVHSRGCSPPVAIRRQKPGHLLAPDRVRIAEGPASTGVDRRHAARTHAAHFAKSLGRWDQKPSSVDTSLARIVLAPQSDIDDDNHILLFVDRLWDPARNEGK